MANDAALIVRWAVLEAKVELATTVKLMVPLPVPDAVTPVTQPGWSFETVQDVEGDALVTVSEPVPEALLKLVDVGLIDSPRIMLTVLIPANCGVPDGRTAVALTECDAALRLLVDI